MKSMFWDRFRKKHQEKALLVFRIVVGALFFIHGAQKFGILDGTFALPGMTQMIVAGTIEMLAGVLVVLGLCTAIAAFVASGEMAVAYFLVHAEKGFLPILNGGEPAVLFCFAFLLLWMTGPGTYSLDAALSKKRVRNRR